MPQCLLSQQYHFGFIIQLGESLVQSIKKKMDFFGKDPLLDWACGFVSTVHFLSIRNDRLRLCGTSGSLCNTGALWQVLLHPAYLWCRTMKFLVVHYIFSRRSCDSFILRILWYPPYFISTWRRKGELLGNKWYPSPSLSFHTTSSFCYGSATIRTTQSSEPMRYH